MEIKNLKKDDLDQNILDYMRHCSSKITKENIDSLGIYKTAINRISDYCNLYDKHLFDFTENQIISYLIEDAVSTNPIESRAYRADEFLKYLNISDSHIFTKYIGKAIETWKSKILNGDDAKIINYEKLIKIIEEIQEVYPFYQHSLIWILRFHGLSWGEIDKLKYTDVDFERRILTTKLKTLYINDLLLEYIKKCQVQKSFKSVRNGKIRNKNINDNEYVISGVKSRTSNKNFKITNRIYRIAYTVFDNYNIKEKNLQYFSLLPKSGMLNEFCYNNVSLNDRNILEYLRKFDVLKDGRKEHSINEHRENFKLLYNDYILQNKKYLIMQSSLLESICYDNSNNGELEGEVEEAKNLTNKPMPIDFKAVGLLYDDNKIKSNTSKYQGRMEVGNKSEEFVMKQYTNAHYVDDVCGFDIYDEDTNTYIEVKTVDANNEFIISLRELMCAEYYKDKYMIYLIKYKNDEAYSFMKIYDPIKYFNIDIAMMKFYTENENCNLIPRSYTIKVK